jgi:hypothetical protein
VITIKLELDPGDGSKPQMTSVQIDQEELPEAKRAMQLLAAALRNPEQLVHRLMAAGIGRAVGRGLERLLSPKRK